MNYFKDNYQCIKKNHKHLPTKFIYYITNFDILPKKKLSNMDDIIFPYDIYLFSIIYIHIFVRKDSLQVCTNTFTKELTCQKKKCSKKIHETFIYCNFFTIK